MRIGWKKTVADRGFKCTQCGMQVFNKEMQQLMNVSHSTAGLFNEVGVLRCRRCGDDVAKVAG